MDDKELENQNSKKTDNGQKTAHAAGKAAATYYGGNIGGQLYDAASQTKVGQALEKAAGNVVNNAPLLNQTSQKVNNSEGLDTTNNIDNSTDDVANNTDDSSSKKSGSIFNKGKGNGKGIGSMFGSNEQDTVTSENKSYASKIFSLILQHKQIFIPIVGYFLLFLVLVVAVIAIIGSVAGTVIDFFSGIKDSIIGFFSKDQQELMDEYYKTLADVQKEINRDYGICIDVNLITATLTINTSPDDFVEDGTKLDQSGEGQIVQNPDGSSTNKPYDKMTKQIKLLANMQIMKKKYSLDQNLKEVTGSYCSTTSGEKLVDSTNTSAFNIDLVGEILNGENDLDSSTYEKIASHDKGSVFGFFSKKSEDEKNYAYYLYYPPVSSDGTCSDSYAESMLPNDVPVLSIGDLKTKEESVYYWNLINSFIPDYYDEYLPKDEPARTERIHEIAEEIYLFYNDMGTSQTCSVAYGGPSSLCPNGITVTKKDDDGNQVVVGTFDFEEYIAGVVTNEAYNSEGMEALKAQAVAARTFALFSTDNCTKTISNSTAAQTFTRDINDRARQAVNETAGEILVNSDGEVFSSQYDSFCYDDDDCPDSVKNSDGTYTVTYTKVPDGEKHVITLSDPKYYDWIVYPNKGHAHGMSQLVSYQMANEGKTYQEILAYFYSDSVQISLVISPTNTDGATIAQSDIGTILINSGSSIDEMNQYIFTQVKKAGVSTRSGVVAAASSLISGIYNKTGNKLAYELKPSGKYSGYGIDPNWGTPTGNATYPLNGLDCSGFISWAIHNGGYEYVIKSAKGWGQAGASRKWFNGTTDNTAQPGDLIYNEPPRENGTTGHIRMIVDVTSDGYVVAEASSGKNGVRINTVSFTSTGSYYLVDMTNYYNSATKVTDYP